MRICAYEVRQDERHEFESICRQSGVECLLYNEIPSIETAHLANGSEGVTILGQGRVDPQLLKAWQNMGVRFLSTRTIGTDHIDLVAASRLGFRICHSNYPPSGVGEFVIMLMLMCLRNYKQALWRGQVNDFSLAGLEGRELGKMTVGIIGTGKIGKEVIGLLRGFGCHLLAYNPHPDESLYKTVKYVDLQTLYRESDIITLHVPLVQSTYHMINEETISCMKDGVVIINCARGELADTEALIRGIESEKIGALGLDVLEDEKGITHVDHRVDILSNQKMAYLRQFRNVIMTPHMAFYTETAVHSMVEQGVLGLLEMSNNRPCSTELDFKKYH